MLSTQRGGRSLGTTTAQGQNGHPGLLTPRSESVHVMHVSKLIYSLIHLLKSQVALHHLGGIFSPQGWASTLFELCVYTWHLTYIINFVISFKNHTIGYMSPVFEMRWITEVK